MNIFYVILFSLFFYKLIFKFYVEELFSWIFLRRFIPFLYQNTSIWYIMMFLSPIFFLYINLKSTKFDFSHIIFCSSICLFIFSPVKKLISIIELSPDTFEVDVDIDFDKYRKINLKGHILYLLGLLLGWFLFVVEIINTPDGRVFLNLFQNSSLDIMGMIDLT